jgi:hypothetical protein
MSEPRDLCSDCDGGFDRRKFLRVVTAGAAAAAAPLFATPRVSAAPSPSSAAETAVKGLYDTLTDEQKQKICFDWDSKDKKRGLLRTFVSNNWQITEPKIRGDFFSKKQQDIIHDAFKGMINPEWYGRFLKHLKDDTGGEEWGADQSIALFGKPGGDKFEFVMTGRHMTLRADGNTGEHVAFGGPIFYGHAAGAFVEKAGHPGNVFWPQAVAANKLFGLLDDKQQSRALVAKRPHEAEVAFRGDKGGLTGLPVGDLADDQKKEIQKVLGLLVEPFRKDDQDEVIDCLKKQGGLDKCSLTFYEEGSLGKGVYDNWRLEGPAFVWYFRGTPHVHVWVNVADDPSVALNARG